MLAGNKETTQSYQILFFHQISVPKPQRAKPSDVQNSQGRAARQQSGSWERDRVYEVPEPNVIQAWPKYMRTIIINNTRNER